MYGAEKKRGHLGGVPHPLQVRLESSSMKILPIGEPMLDTASP